MAVTVPAQQRGEGPATGLLVTGAVPDGPADAAGMLVGDVIVASGGAPVAEADDLLTLLRGHQVGQTVTLTAMRRGAA